MTVPDGDHLTLLDVYNNYVQSMYLASPSRFSSPHNTSPDMHDKNWTWTNYLSQRALAQADNVRAQLQRTMERYDVDIISIQDERKLYINIRQALVCGFFMQVAHKEGEKGNYLTVKDNQVNISSSSISGTRNILSSVILTIPFRSSRYIRHVGSIHSPSGSSSTNSF